MQTQQAFKLETKLLAPEKEIHIDKDWVIEGYASVFSQTDQGGDIVQKGAFGKSLNSLAQKKQSVKMLWQHDQSQPIGVWDDVIEDNNGLFVRGRLLPSVKKAQEAAELIKAGALDGLSIGYKTIKSSKSSDGNRLLIELDLWEVSLVTFPMLDSARVLAKSNQLSLRSSLSDLADLMRQTASTLNNLGV